MPIPDWSPLHPVHEAGERAFLSPLAPHDREHFRSGLNDLRAFDELEHERN